MCTHVHVCLCVKTRVWQWVTSSFFSTLFIYLSIYLFIIVCLFIFYTNSVMHSGQYTARSSCFYSLTKYWNCKCLVFGFCFVSVVIGDQNTDHHVCVTRLSQHSHLPSLRCIWFLFFQSSSVFSKNLAL